MKTINEILKDKLKQLKDNVLCHYLCTTKGYEMIPEPKFANEITCRFCGNSEYITYAISKNERAWMCNPICAGSKLPNDLNLHLTKVAEQRAILWPLFCEINGIGDMNYGVTFEKVEQSQAKIDYMKKFVDNPHGFIVMQGKPGTGKTYCAMAMCELFTRKSQGCKFLTSKQMISQWQQSFNDPLQKFSSSLCNVPLLVIDDFGSGEPSPKFMEFFLDILNTRMQWKNRGTVITTNLNDEKLSIYCGDALSDRLCTGQLFKFDGETRRRPHAI